MKKKKFMYSKLIHFRHRSILMFIFLLLICTACAKKQDVTEMLVDEIPPEQVAEKATEKTVLISERIQLNFTTQDFSNRALSLLEDSQIGCLVSSTKIDDGVTYGKYVPTEFSEENPKRNTYSYIEVYGINYELSHSLGDTWYDLEKTTLNVADIVYKANELRGANYVTTIFLVIKEKKPYIISEIDGFAQMSDIDENGTNEVISTVGTVPDTSIYFFDFEKETVSSVNINVQSGAQYSMYNVKTNTFSLAFASDQNPLIYTYEMNGLLRIE